MSSGEIYFRLAPDLRPLSVVAAGAGPAGVRDTLAAAAPGAWERVEAAARDVAARGERLELRWSEAGRAFRCRLFPERDGAGPVLAIAGLLEEAPAAEEALVASEQRFRTLADAIPHIVCALGYDGSPDYVNAHWITFSGVGIREARRLGWLGLLHPDDVPIARECRRRAIVTRAPQEAELRYRAADGTYRWFLSRLAPVEEPGGGKLRFVGAAVDIDDRKRAEAAREDLLVEAQEGDRRKSEFLAVLSHELRNPLAAIRNGVYLLERVPPGGERAARAQAVIDRQSQQLARLVDDLLDVTRIVRGKIVLHRERVDAREVLRRSCEDHADAFEAGRLSLRVALPGAPVWIEADPARLAQVVGNLLHNAAKFTPAGGAVTVALEAAGELATIRVRDDGVGMSPAELPRVFEPFVQAPGDLARSRGGLGLGLALVKGLVELHGGSVSARSDGLGTGAEFEIRLPASPPAPAAAPGPGGGARPAGRLVLVVEDGADAGEMLVDVLQLAGHRAHLARDGRSAIALARQLRPDVVLCDIGLPDLDGYAVARALRADPALRATRLVALSGYAQPEDRERAREAGFHAHLAKPPPPDELEAELAMAVGEG